MISKPEIDFSVGDKYISFLSWTGCILGIFLIIFEKIKIIVAARSQLKKAERKRRIRDSILDGHIVPLSISSEMKQKILDSTVVELIEMLNRDEVSSEDILCTYYLRSKSIGRDLFLITESNFEAALELAKECDEIRKNTPQDQRTKLGPLFGIPISVKDVFKQKGFDATYGIVELCFKPQSIDAVNISLLKEAGAIPFIRSTGPQLMSTADSHSHVWGIAKNPWNIKRSPGGSSGGEGGLISSRCSPIGLGSDIGGSIRIPALDCGVYGLKPTVDRLSIKGMVFPNEISSNPNKLIRTSPGPMGRCVEDLRLMMKALTNQKLYEYDPKLPHQMWDEKWEREPIKELRIGIVENEEFAEVSDPNKRAINEVDQFLRSKGHTIIKVKLPNFEEAFYTYLAIMYAEGNMKTFRKALNGEPFTNSYKLALSCIGIPNPLRKPLSWVYRKLGEIRTAKFIECSGQKTVLELNDWIKQMDVIRDELFSIWKINKLDAIICPGLTMPALRHEDYPLYGLRICYAFYWNLVNFTVGAMPITRVKANETKFSNEKRKYKGDRFDKLAVESIQNTTGLPVGVQVVTLPFEEEKCLSIMKEIEKQFGFHDFSI